MPDVHETALMLSERRVTPTARQRPRPVLIPELLPGTWGPARDGASPTSGRLAGWYGEPHVSWVGLLVDVYG